MQSEEKGVERTELKNVTKSFSEMTNIQDKFNSILCRINTMKG